MADLRIRGKMKVKTLME